MSYDEALAVLRKFEYSSFEGWIKRNPEEDEYREAMAVMEDLVHRIKGLEK